ncbi:UDP-glucuronic acid decarboxylase 1 [Canna indica]|uniref:UDP-glucuronic acid decarboxylase 1 n=1 Tax=Canna indica TaxID=4628 RepID=A0AAQ3JQK9_9LILI|nr:UDP-glucuronic acid decarboxylase 1 [Canna indica]
MKQLHNHKQGSLNQQHHQIPTNTAKLQGRSSTVAPFSLLQTARHLAPSLSPPSSSFTLATIPPSQPFTPLTTFSPIDTSPTSHPSSLSSTSDSAYSSIVGDGDGRRASMGVKKSVKQIVVTRGVSFVRSHLVDKLLAMGDSMIELLGSEPDRIWINRVGLLILVGQGRVVLESPSLFGFGTRPNQCSPLLKTT